MDEHRGRDPRTTTGRLGGQSPRQELEDMVRADLAGADLVSELLAERRSAAELDDA